MLQFSYRLAVIRNGSHRFAVDLRNHVSASESQIIGKRSRIDFSHQYTLLPFHSDAVPAVRRQLFHVQAVLWWRRFAGLIAQPPRRIREHPRPAFALPLLSLLPPL